jgi:hypothetical protein
MVDERPSLRSRLAHIRAHEGYERWVQRTDVPLMVLAMLFLLVLLVPVIYPAQPAALRVMLGVLNILI